MNETANILRKNGLKVTPQRMAIYSMLSNTKSHPNAEEIYKTLEKDNPTMSLATVYKTLDSFKNISLVQELNVGDGCSHYDAEIKTHPHFYCRGCGKVFDLDVDGIDNIKEMVQDKTDFQIEKEQLLFFGHCPECKSKQY